MFCLTRTPVTEPRRQWEALLLDPATGKVTDFSARFEKAFGDGWVSSLGPVWTPDGKYLVAAAEHRRGTLIGLEPWEVIPIADRLSEELELGYRLTDLCALPIPGWLRAGGPERQYLVDYTGRRAVVLDNGRFWSCSPDGKLSAVVGRWTGRITLDRLSLPLRDDGVSPGP